MNENAMMFQTLGDEELICTDGGGIALGIAVVICLGALALGAYNGYQDTKDQKK